MPTALIDGDIVVYTAASIAERDCPFDGGTRKDMPFDRVCEEIIIQVQEIMEGARCDTFSFILSPDDRRNFRKVIYPAYKANRKPKPKPDMYWPLIEWVRQDLHAYDLPGVEGDDLIGLLHMEDPENTVMVSSDKDLKTIPGTLYNPMRDVIETTSINEANHFWMTQVLTGDSTDNYPGCPRIGKVKAAKMLEDPLLQTHPEFYLRRNWRIVYDAFLDHYIDPQVALDKAILQARLARILRAGDYDYETESVRLWHPELTDEYLHLAAEA